jgi:hypothetical protein
MVNSYHSRRFPVFHLKIRADLTQFTSRRVGKLGEYSDKNERGGPQCPNIHPRKIWVNIRTDFQGLAFCREAGHFSRESCNTGFHLL